MPSYVSPLSLSKTRCSRACDIATRVSASMIPRTACTQHVLTFTRTHARTDAQLKRRRTFETNNEKKIRKDKESAMRRARARRGQRTN